MAIILKVDEYCQDCRDFDPDVDRYARTMEGKLFDTVIRCMNRFRCDRMIEYLEKKKETDT